MIPTKARVNRRMKVFKLTKNLERKYKEVNCHECSVVVTPMDFAKILGRFTKVKIQYESSSKSKPKQTNVISPNSRLKAKENGMVQIHGYNVLPATKLQGQKKLKSNTATTPTSNVLKENNRLKKEKDAFLEYNLKPLMKTKVKYYGVVFDKPSVEGQRDTRNKISLQELVSDIDKSILPAEDWCIDYFPKNGEPKDDKIYDRIAAELEDLMYNEKAKNSSNVKDSKNDEFPSILDILNENTKDGTTKASDPASSLNLESSDVEAMLLGNASPATEPSPMEVDSSSSDSINKAAQATTKPEESKAEKASTVDDNPESPSILDEPIQKETSSTEKPKISIDDKALPKTSQTSKIDENDNTNKKNKNSPRTGVTQIIFKKLVNGTCSKSVTCPKNLKYSISMLGNSVELLGAPKHISSLEDLQILLQIVEESDLDNLYVLH